MVMDIREAAKIIILEDTDWGGTVFKTARGHIVAAADDADDFYVPAEVTKAIIKKYKTRFFRIHEKQGEIILTPTKVQLEVVEEEETFPIVQDKSQGEKPE